MYIFKKNEAINGLNTDGLISKFEEFSNNKVDALYLTEITQTEWLKMLDEYWDEGYTLYSGGFYLWPQWLF